MLYRVAKPLQYFQIGAQMDIDPEKPFYVRLINNGTLEPVHKKPKASKREKKVVEPTESKADDGQDE